MAAVDSGEAEPSEVSTVVTEMACSASGEIEAVLVPWEEAAVLREAAVATEEAAASAVAVAASGEPRVPAVAAASDETGALAVALAA